MFFWYLGAGSALLLVTLGPRRIDYRLALLGLVLPLADVVIRILAYPHSRLGVHLYLHTFAFALVLALAVMTFLRGATARRWFVVPMAVVIHLLLAGMLGDPVGLFWPLLGSSTSPSPSTWTSRQRGRSSSGPARFRHGPKAPLKAPGNSQRRPSRRRVIPKTRASRQ